MKHTLLALALLICCNAWAQNSIPTTTFIQEKPRGKNTDANIYGHIIAAENDEHIPYATIAV